MQQISQPQDLTKGLRIPREIDSGGQWDTESDFPVSVQEFIGQLLWDCASSCFFCLRCDGLG